MNTYLIIGAPGMGKSPFVREMIGTDKRCCVFDIANEYGQRTKYPGMKPLGLSDVPGAPRFRYTGVDLMKFIDLCSQRRNSICIFEEATGFLQGKLQLKVTQLIINRYHTGNSYVFIFHSINSVPPRIMEMCNTVVLFKTNDEDYTVLNKYRKIHPLYAELQTTGGGEYRIKKML
jgi:hypothetical protein